MFRNREFQRLAILFVAVAAAAVGIGFALNAAAGILVAAFAAIAGVAFFVYTKARYRSIAKLSEQIDIVLHGADRLKVAEPEEGELSILYSEITKMTLRIREQNEALKKEKEHLADSLADIAHQLRTPLTSANLLLSLIENSSDESERKILVREAEDLLLRMDWLITSLLKLSRLDAGVVAFGCAPIEVDRLMTAALRPLQIPMELHNIDVRIDAPAGIAIFGDARWLSEAIQNILKNCMESVGENGRIEIDCEDNPLYVGITIHDSGAGFAKEDIPRLFDRFYRGKDADLAGYGIGLALCKMIITGQGGTIVAKNHPKGGAVFAIRFPK